MDLSVGSGEPVEYGLSAVEKLQEIHRQQKKELSARIASMRYSVAKNDRKAKKEMTATVEKLEQEMKERHEKELASLKAAGAPAETDSANFDVNEDERTSNSYNTDQQPRVSKAQKRREKKAETQRRMVEAAEKDAESAKFAPRTLETDAIKVNLLARNLRLHEIPPDGDCLYNAVAHQLSLCSGLPTSISGRDIRRKAAAYILANKDDFLPFLTWHDGSPIDEFEFEKYCGLVERSCEDGGEWGGEPELRAISSALEKRIEVLQPEGRVAVFGEHFSSKPLIITYHRHAYSLGEHYNSTEVATFQK